MIKCCFPKIPLCDTCAHTQRHFWKTTFLHGKHLYTNQKSTHIDSLGKQIWKSIFVPTPRISLWENKKFVFIQTYINSALLATVVKALVFLDHFKTVTLRDGQRMRECTYLMYSFSRASCWQPWLLVTCLITRKVRRKVYHILYVGI